MARKRIPTRFQLGRGNMFPDGGGIEGIPIIQEAMDNAPKIDFGDRVNAGINDFFDNPYWNMVSVVPDEYRNFDMNEATDNALLTLKPRSETNTGLQYASLPEVEVVPNWFQIYRDAGDEYSGLLWDKVMDESINPSISLDNPYYITTNEKGIWPNDAIKDNNSIITDDLLEKVYNASREAGVNFYQGLASTMKEMNGLTRFFRGPSWQETYSWVFPKEWGRDDAVPNYLPVKYWRGTPLPEGEFTPYNSEIKALNEKYGYASTFDELRNKNKLLRQAYKSTKKKAEKELVKARTNLLTRAFDDAWHKKNYNPGQKDYNKQLQQHVKALMTSPEIKAWLDWKEGRTKERDTSKIRYVKRAYGGKLRRRLSI